MDESDGRTFEKITARVGIRGKVRFERERRRERERERARGRYEEGTLTALRERDRNKAPLNRSMYHIFGVYLSR